MAAMKFAGSPTPTIATRGFTLIELAIVMFIVTLLLGGMLLPLSAQQDIRNFGDTQKGLADARDALLGFAIANDRLPCPASTTSNGQESFCTTSGGACTETTSLQTHGRCAYPHDGFFPAATLGLSPVDAQGYLLDGWGGESAHRVRYGISTANSSAFSTTSGMKNTGITTLAPDLEICSNGAQIRIPPVTTAPDTSLMYCHPSFRLASDAVAVVYSLGKNAGTGGTGDDEKHNPNPQSAALVAPDRAFANATQGTAFDDQMVWLSKNILFNRMVAAGKLP
jgi:prepilin-type N-terminal cleavage/methylation domain-containing protein